MRIVVSFVHVRRALGRARWRDRSRIASPAALLDRANDHLCAIGIPGTFITAFSGALDTKTGPFTYSGAGHPSPLLVPAAGGPVTPVERANFLPLGILADETPRTERSVTLEPGDLLLLHTHCITEARSATGEFFGVTRLSQVLGSLPRPSTPDHVVRAVRRSVESFSGAGTPADDQTLLALRWQP